ncbi:MAG TPA: hypothetical protein DEA08_30140, partial [Planctomycetes bacterium]|nr:hypothetical protein [Planctomycetota bacterium]
MSLTPRRAPAQTSKWFALALGLGVVGAYLLLAPALPEAALPEAARPEAQPSESTQAAVHEDEHGECGHEEEAHGQLGHSCGLDAKAMLSRFRQAVEASKGAAHAVVERAGVTIAKGQALVGLAEDAALEPSIEVLRRGPGYALVAGDLDELRARLAGAPGVTYVEPNVVAKVALTPNDPFYPRSGHQSAALEQAWDTSTGQNVIVAVLDTGADTAHPDLTNRLVAGFDFVNNTATISDDNGHGTATAGIVAAEGQNNEGVVGVAFDARVMPVKVADQNGNATVADVAAGIDFAIQNQADVINLSLGAPVGSQVLEDAINRALQAGIVVVAAAGNDPVHHEVFPAAYPGVISVTALGQDGKLGFDAVLAEGVEVGAPGEQVITTLPGGVYGFVTGSSAASAYTAGVAALARSRTPTLTGEQVARLLRTSQREIPELAVAGTTYRFGHLDPEQVVLRASTTYVDHAVTHVEVYPDKPIPGQPAEAVVEVSNEGAGALTQRILRVARIEVGTTARIEIGFRVFDLAAGERREIRIPFSAPPAANYEIRATLSTAPGETETADNVRSITRAVGAGAVADVRVVSRRISDPVASAGTVTATVVVENRGTAVANNVNVHADVSAAGASAAAPAALVPTAAGGLGVQTIPTLAVGARATVQFTWTIPNVPPLGILRLRAHAFPLTGETAVADNTAFLDFQLGTSANLRGLYQQSNGVDVIHDAPYRIAPGRPYVPVQVFVASKGGRTTSTRLAVARTTVEVRDTPTGAGTVVYDDTRAGAATATSGLEVVDELGNARTAPLDLFSGQDLDMNGRHEILRLPRSALGVSPSPAAGVDKFVASSLEWEQERVVLWMFRRTRNGRHRAVCKVHFASDDLPSLPGDNHYHDVHHHTIAEWYFGSPLDIFAPRKAYGGPLQMVFESAYVMGLINGPTAQDARMRIITTDHSSFNNRTVPSPDGPDHRPPFGPQSITAQPGTTQLEAYRNIFGRTAGEEIAFKQDVPLPRIPYLNKILNLLPGIPLGAHMLLYGADHVEGPWHGGGWLKGPGNPNINVDLFPLLYDVAKRNQTRQSDAFAYAAHPFSGQGWNDNNFARGFGLDPANRTRDEVHDGTNEFVLKGLEWFNGRGTRSLPSAQIDFEDLNPWASPDFQAGSSDWDKGLWDGLGLWHEALSKTLEYSFVSDPEVRFIRKIYQAGGSDAHGDFNFSTGRAATPLNIQATYNVGDEAYYKVRTYCFGDGKAGPTSGDRWLEAYRDGNSVTTDGPLTTFDLDAQPRFDAANLRWHDQRAAFEDRDGRIGGEGALDGGFTALVERGSLAPLFRYRYETNAEYGAIASLKLYKTEAGAPNPSRRRVSGFAGISSYDQPTGVNDLALSGAGAWHEHAFDAAKEGPVTKNTAFALGAYTVGDPDQADLGSESYRCWTNPIFAVPFDSTVDVGAPVNGVIPAGELKVTYRFDVSMDPSSYRIEVKPLDANGESTPGTSPAMTPLVPVSGSGWSDRPGIKASELTLVNAYPIALGGDEYPAGSGNVRFVVYWRDAPRDHFGNDLNRLATTFDATRVPGSGSTASPVTSGSSSTAAGATAGTPASSGGGSSGGG